MRFTLTKTFVLAFVAIATCAGVLRSIEDLTFVQTVAAQPVLFAYHGALRAVPVSGPRQQRRPKIRVGLYSSDDPVTVTIARQSQIMAGAEKTIVQTIPAEQAIMLSFDRAAQTYTVSSGDWSFTTSAYVKIQPRRAHTVATIASYSHPPAWDTTLNDNQFFGAIELHYAAATDTIWVINELGIENYVTGVAEAGNDNSPAYLKALYTAARTYGYYLYLHPTKHAAENYIVDTTPNDQVYRGYGFTQRAPNVAAAVQATVGVIVHYGGEPVVTPYFSQSDGRTRAWSEVWSGDYPYLQSVADPGCSGDSLLGHGVGLSAKGARYFVNEDDWHWRQILTYYYQGITLKQLW